MFCLELSIMHIDYSDSDLGDPPNKEILLRNPGARLTKAYDVTMKKYSKSHKNISQ